MKKTYKVIIDKLPINCYKCPFGIYSNYIYIPTESKAKQYPYKCFFTQKAMTGTRRNRFCPLEEADE